MREMPQLPDLTPSAPTQASAGPVRAFARRIGGIDHIVRGVGSTLDPRSDLLRRLPAPPLLSLLALLIPFIPLSVPSGLIPLPVLPPPGLIPLVLLPARLVLTRRLDPRIYPAAARTFIPSVRLVLGPLPIPLPVPPLVLRVRPIDLLDPTIDNFSVDNPLIPRIDFPPILFNPPPIIRLPQIGVQVTTVKRIDPPTTRIPPIRSNIRLVTPIPRVSS